MTTGPATMLAAFDHRVRRDRDEVFLMVPGGAALTFGQVDERASRLAHRLAAGGARPGSRIGLHLLNDPRWVVALLAVWRCGAEAVVLSGLLRPGELRRLVDQARPELLLSTEELDAGDRPRTLRLTEDCWTGGDSVAPVAEAPAPEQPACLFPTSGTTGPPKPVTHTHGDLAGAAEQMANIYPKTPGFRDRTAPARVPPGVIFYPFGHVACLHALAFRLWVGRRVVLVPKFSVPALDTVLRQYRIDALQLVPAMIHELVETTAQVDLSSVAYVIAGTAPLSLATRTAFEKRYGIPVLSTYGSTEVGPVAHVRYSDITSGALPEGSVGRAATGVEVRFVDEHGNDVADGREGELVVRKGGEEGRWIRTGDVGRADEQGFLFVTGRLSDMMIVGGFNVFPEEIERAIERTGLVQAAVVVAVPDARLGQIPVAGVVGTSAAEREELLRRLRTELAAYKIPRQVLPIDAVPLTARQKVDRRAAERLISRLRAAERVS